jgi:hypothetical protein
MTNRSLKISVLVRNVADPNLVGSGIIVPDPDLTRKAVYL